MNVGAAFYCPRSAIFVLSLLSSALRFLPPILSACLSFTTTPSTPNRPSSLIELSSSPISDTGVCRHYSKCTNSGCLASKLSRVPLFSPVSSEGGVCPMKRCMSLTAARDGVKCLSRSGCLRPPLLLDVRLGTTRPSRQRQCGIEHTRSILRAISIDVYCQVLPSTYT
ncbi:hypothetical protein V8C44DRAFT_21258 [Trichoderma aethiopicum]